MVSRSLHLSQPRQRNNNKNRMPNLARRGAALWPEPRFRISYQIKDRQKMTSSAVFLRVGVQNNSGGSAVAYACEIYSYIQHLHITQSCRSQRHTKCTSVGRHIRAYTHPFESIVVQQQNAKQLNRGTYTLISNKAAQASRSVFHSRNDLFGLQLFVQDLGYQ